MVGEVKGIKGMEGCEEGRELVVVRLVDILERRPNNVSLKDSSLSICMVPVPIKCPPILQRFVTA